MKRQLLTILVFACYITAAQAETPDKIKALKKEIKSKVKIGAVHDKTISDRDDNESEQIHFNTYLSRKCKTEFKLRVTVELTDKRGRGDVYYATLTSTHSSANERTDPTGQEEWVFEIPHGKMENPKITAYAIQSGIQRNGKFTPLFNEFDDVDSVEEITGRENTKQIEMECTGHTTWVKRL